MGACSTKPKVLKDESDENVNAPEPEPEPEPQASKVEVVDESNVAEEAEPEPETNTGVVDDDQTNKRRSLSLLFNKESDDTEASTEHDKIAVEEIVKQETLEAQKTLEDSKSNEAIVKNESSNAEENQELKNEPVEQDSPLLTKLEEISSVQIESIRLDEEIVKVESIIEEIVKVESKIEEIVKLESKIETPKQEVVEAKVTPSHGSKSDKPETLIEALSKDAVSVIKIITDKATFGEEKNHNEVEHASKGSDASKH